MMNAALRHKEPKNDLYQQPLGKHQPAGRSLGRIDCEPGACRVIGAAARHVNRGRHERGSPCQHRHSPDDDSLNQDRRRNHSAPTPPQSPYQQMLAPPHERELRKCPLLTHTPTTTNTPASTSRRPTLRCPRQLWKAPASRGTGVLPLMLRLRLPLSRP